MLDFHQKRKTKCLMTDYPLDSAAQNWKKYETAEDLCAAAPASLLKTVFGTARASKKLHAPSIRNNPDAAEYLIVEVNRLRTSKKLAQDKALQTRNQDRNKRRSMQRAQAASDLASLPFAEYTAKPEWGGNGSSFLKDSFDRPDLIKKAVDAYSQATSNEALSVRPCACCARSMPSAHFSCFDLDAEGVWEMFKPYPGFVDSRAAVRDNKDRALVLEKAGVDMENRELWACGECLPALGRDVSEHLLFATCTDLNPESA